MKCKNLKFILVILAISTMLLSACEGISNSENNGESQRSQSRKTSDDEEENSKEDDDKEKNDKEDDHKNDIDDKRSNKDNDEYLYSFSGVLQSYEAEEWFNVEAVEYAELNIIDDYNCEFLKYVHYEDNCNTNYYAANYKYDSDNDCYIVSYFDGYDECICGVYVDGDEIVSVNWNVINEDIYSSIIGDHSFDSELGKIEFSVDKNGLEGRMIYIDGEEIYDADLFLYDIDGENGDKYSAEWDLTFIYGDDSYFDWFLYFDGDDTSYEPYKKVLYGEYAGRYDMDGELGPITVNVSEIGEASATVKIDGEKYTLSGDISVTNEGEDISFDLYDENLTLHLDVDRFEDGDMYQGNYTITKVLAAG